MLEEATALIVALAGGIAIDWTAGDPPNRYHPVAWIGRLIERIVPYAKGGRHERFLGGLLACGIIALAGFGAHLLALASFTLVGIIGFVIASSVLLKMTIAIKGMERHARTILNCLDADDIQGARRNLSLIVRRDTRDLDKQHILSATIECVGESTVDGIAGPLFYYSLLGPAGAFAYRAINTLDSMVGYKDDYYKNIGWMSARIDTTVNYLPARLTAFLMIISASILGADWRSSVRILQRDHVKTVSPNAGYPMATMAGALRVRLEKIGHYSLGDDEEEASIEKCQMAVSIMKLTSILICLVYSVPTIILLYFAGWWRLLLFGSS
jgi:adenosylcobinamide-phosphate synthase